MRFIIFPPDGIHTYAVVWGLTLTGTPRSADFLPRLRLLYPSGALTSTHRLARWREGRAQLALPFGLSLQLF